MHHAPGIKGTVGEAGLTGRLTQTIADKSRHWESTLKTICDAMRDGLAAQRRYELLRRKGMAHDTAIRHGLGISRPDT